MSYPTKEPGYPTRPCPRCRGQRVAAQLHNEYADNGSIHHTRVMLKCLDCGDVRWFENLEAGMHHWILTDENGMVHFGKDGLTIEMSAVE